MSLYDFIQKIRRWLFPAVLAGAVATTMHPNVLENLKLEEGGCRNGVCEAYIDPVGEPTIGYGHTMMAGTVAFAIGDTWTEEYATQVLDQDIKQYWDAVQAAVTVPIDQCQSSVLTSWTYNVGIGAMQSSTLVRLLNQGNYDAVPAQLNRWNKGGGRVLPGLVARRAREGQLWATDCAAVR